MCDNARTKGADANCFAHARDYAIDETIGRAALAAMDEAAALAESDAVRLRVEKASIWALRAAVGDLPKRLSAGMRDQWNRGEITLDDFPTMNADDIAKKEPHMRKLLALCKKQDVDRWSEGWSLEQAIPVLQKFLAQVAPELVAPIRQVAPEPRAMGVDEVLAIDFFRYVRL